jgi:hypothetical protein
VRATLNLEHDSRDPGREDVSTQVNAKQSKEKLDYENMNVKQHYWILSNLHSFQLEPELA